jgi:hypothetical protein
MQLQLNLEAPGFTTMQVAQMLRDRLLARTVKVRVESNEYDGPEGRVHEVVFIALVDEPAFDAGTVSEIVGVLSSELHQDCIAIKVDGYGTLAGPRADKWLPFNPKFFKEYRA